MNRQKQLTKNVKEDIHNEVDEIILQCGNLKGDLAIKCFSKAHDFKDEMNEVFKGEVRK